MPAWREPRNVRQRCILEEDKSWLARHSPRSRLRDQRGQQPPDSRWQPSLGVVCATPGIAHAPEWEKTLGYIPELPPCREVLSSKHPMSQSPTLPTHSLGQLALTQGWPCCKEWTRKLKLPFVVFFFFCIFLLSPHLSSETGKKRKQEGRKDQEEPAVLRTCSKEPLRKELQLGSPKEPADFNPATCCPLLQVWFLRGGEKVGEVS